MSKKKCDLYAVITLEGMNWMRSHVSANFKFLFVLCLSDMPTRANGITTSKKFYYDVCGPNKGIKTLLTLYRTSSNINIEMIS